MKNHDNLGSNFLDKLSEQWQYEKRSTIFTTNQPFSKWGEVFGDSVIASAIVDRIVHHCEIVKITGQSYRIKGKVDLTKEDN